MLTPVHLGHVPTAPSLSVSVVEMASELLLGKREKEGWLAFEGGGVGCVCVCGRPTSSVGGRW